MQDCDHYHLIQPSQTPIDLGRPYPFGKPMRLPSITCVAGLRYHGTSNPAIGGISELTLIWLQEDFALPVVPDVIEKINQLDWFSLAKDISWDEF